jgi:hypothetical protein
MKKIKTALKKCLNAIIKYGVMRVYLPMTKSGFLEPIYRISPENSHYPPPPNIIPENMINEYTLNGKIRVIYRYHDCRILDGKIIHNTEKMYKNRFKEFAKGKFFYDTYGNEGQALLQALQKYPINNCNVIVWGLAGCNCEALSVWAGASKVYVVDYNKPVCDNDRIEVMNHEEITTKLSTGVDFAISYSSFEHDGLGGYGDPLSANGDFRAMKEAHKFLNKDGILLLGVPLGQDCLIWNGQRIYGKHRLPLLLKNWQLLDVFDMNKKNTVEYPFDLEFATHIQNVLVLKRIENDYPDDYYLTKACSRNIEINAEDIFIRINRMIYEYKHSV